MRRNKSFYSTREAADLLGVALRTVQVWVENGVLPAWKTAGGHRRIPPSAVDKLSVERTVIRDAREDMVARTCGQFLRILVVDDAPEIISLYEARIRQWNLPVSLATASNGFEGLVRIGQFNPQVLIVDLEMPEMDGFQMIHALSRMPKSRAMEVVVVTGLDLAEVRSRLPAGIRLLGKPVPFDELCVTVIERCSREGLMDQDGPENETGNSRRD